MEFDVKVVGGERKAVLSGRLAFEDSAAFMQVLAAVRLELERSWIIDLEGLEFLDSSGIGMFLMLRDVVARAGGKLTFHRPRGQVEKALRNAGLDGIMTIEATN
ncbi:MAG: STAS domain-containing protein [Magnetospirillum sp. WYHS-4]